MTEPTEPGPGITTDRAFSTADLAYINRMTTTGMVLPSVAYNEWGHAFWLMEELFIAPLHWGFVALAWGFMAALGVIGLSLPRVAELVRLTSGPAIVR